MRAVAVGGIREQYRAGRQYAVPVGVSTLPVAGDSRR